MALKPDPRFVNDYRFQNVQDFEFYSSVLVGSGADGVAKFFVTPLGQGMLRLGDVPQDLFPTCLPPFTNVWQPGQLGYAYGDMSIQRVRADFLGGDLPSLQAVLEGAQFELRIAGKQEIDCGFRDLPKALEHALLVGRHDTVEALISFAKKLPQISPLLARVVLGGVTIRDIR